MAFKTQAFKALKTMRYKSIGIGPIP